VTTIASPDAETPTLAQRSAEAVARAAQRLEVDDAKRLAAALAEVAAEELDVNPAFAGRLRMRYEALRQPPAKRKGIPHGGAKKTVGSAGPRPTVAGGRSLGGQVDIVSPLDPHALVPLYGSALSQHLEQYSVRGLSEMAHTLAVEVGERAPAQKHGKPALIAFILRHA
jgi:hypothetical protein